MRPHVFLDYAERAAHCAARGGVAMMSPDDVAAALGIPIKDATPLLAEMRPIRISSRASSMRVDPKHFSAWQKHGPTLLPKVTPVMAEAPAIGGVYFVQIQDHGPIKIGTTRNVRDRLRGLQTSHPYQLRLLGVMPGRHAEEAGLHVRFARHHISGEWFHPDFEIVSLAMEHGDKP